MTARLERKFKIEQYVLGVFLQESHAFNWLGHLLQPEDFTANEKWNHRHIFSVMNSIAPNEFVNVRTIDFYTQRKYAVYLRELTALVCSTGSLPHDVLHLHSINLLENLKGLLEDNVVHPEFKLEGNAAIQELILQNEKFDESEAFEFIDDVKAVLSEVIFPLSFTREVYEMCASFERRFDAIDKQSIIHTLIHNLKSFGSIPVTPQVRDELDWNIQSILTIISTGNLPKRTL